MRYIVSFILLLSFGAWSQSSNEITDEEKLKIILTAREKQEIQNEYLKNSTSEFDTAVKMLTLDFAPYVKTLDRDIVTYNYRDKKTLKLNANEIPSSETIKGIDYAKSWGGAIKTHLPDETGMLGWGMYSSSNIESSSDYATMTGEDDFALVTIKYPREANMLDLRKVGTEGYTIPLSLATLEYLNEICPNVKGRADSNVLKDGTKTYDIHKKYLTKNKKCHDIFITVLDKLNIKGLIYRWMRNDSNYCNNNSRAAFVSVNLKYNEESLDTFTNLPVEKIYPSELKNSDKFFVMSDAEKNKEISDNFKNRVQKGNVPNFSLKDYRKYQKHSLNINSFDRHIFKKDFNFFSSTEEEKKELISEIQKETFGCYEKFKIADAPHYDPSQSLKYIMSEGFSDLSLSDDLLNKLKICP
jgi:hypothetical protein